MDKSAGKTFLDWSQRGAQSSDLSLQNRRRDNVIGSLDLAVAASLSSSHWAAMSTALPFMKLWLLGVGGVAIVLYVLYVCYWEGPWSTKSKHFKLYKVLIDSNRAPDFKIVILKGEIPEKNTVPGFITYIPPRIALRRGLKSHQIVGRLKNFKGGWVSENFSGNKAFKDMIHSIAVREIPRSVLEKAKTLGTGEIRLIDDRISAPEA